VSGVRRVSRRFLARPSVEVAPSLLGKVLVRMLPDGTRIAVRLVETEAYAQDDPASHSFKGETPRTRVMFGAAGHLYVYFAYGMHHCMNVVTGRPGEGSAVLLRAGEPLQGVAAMRARRGLDDLRLLCAGPARLCEALGVDRELDGIDLIEGGRMWIEHGPRPARVAAGPRVGIRRGTDHPWRFVVQGDPFVSRGFRAAAGSSTGGRPQRVSPASAPSRS